MPRLACAGTLQSWPKSSRFWNSQYVEDYSLPSIIRRFRPTVHFLTFVALALSCGEGLAKDELVLAPGDTISYSVLGAAELDRLSTVGVNGQIQVPLIGWIDAAGLTIDELRRKVGSEIGETPFRTTGPDGAEVWRRISSDLIFIDVAQYRPIYLMGDVRENGEQPYRPGITLRQSIARAGGLGQPLSTETSDVELLSLSTERDMLVGDIEFVSVTLARLEADLAAIGDGNAKGAAQAPASNEGAARWLSARHSERQLSRSNSRLQVQQMENRLEVLQELLRSQQTNLEIEQAALDRARDLAERGLTPTTNVTEARRAYLQVSMQALETSGEIHSLQLDLARTTDEDERLQYAQRVDLLAQIVDQTQSHETLKKRLKALEQRISMVGGQGLFSQVEPAYLFEIRRLGEDAIVTSQLSDVVLLPGDVVEVTAVFESEASAATTQ
jgi:polysaccharide biosynthesis/export protein